MSLAEFALNEMPDRITKITKGRGYEIFYFNGQDYIVRYNESSEPQLCGMVAGRITPIGKRYILRFVPEGDLDAQERTAIKSIMASSWD